MKIIRSNISARTLNKYSKVEGIIYYDYDNLYPQRVTNIVNNSGAAKWAINLYAKFMEGNGFKDKVFYKAKINEKGLTMDKLLRKLAKEYANRFGFAVHVNYNGLYKITDIRAIPFADCRLPHPEDLKHEGQIVVYDDWMRLKSNRINKDRFQYFDRFNPDPVVIESQIINAGGIDKWKGQILWYSEAGEDYPLAPFDAVLEDIETDGRIKMYKRKKSASGWNADFAFIHKGTFENDAEREEFKTGLEQFQGDEGEGNIPLIEVEKEEQIPSLLAFPKSSTDKDFLIGNESAVQANIRKAFGFPAVLVGENVAGALGLSAQMKDAYSVMNGLTGIERRLFEEVFKMIFDNWYDININPSKDYSVLPLTYETGDVNQPLAIQFGVGGTTSVKEILIDPALLPAQKINTLVILFGLTLEQANSMVTGAPIPSEEIPI